jgi:adenine-specific DNA-methyltransferase
MIRKPYQPLPFTISPARGQALLSFQGRRMPDHLPLFETVKIEEVRPAPSDQLPGIGQPTPVSGPNLLLHGDCLSACAYLKANNIKVDLFYIDPPFASGANYAKKIYLRNGGKTALDGGSPIGEEIMYGDIWQKEDYLNWLYERLLAMRQVLSETGSIYVQLDWHIGHYVKVLLDEVFGEECFKNEIVWCYSERGISKTYFNRKHDMIYFYTNGADGHYFDPEAAREEYSEESKKKFKYFDETVDDHYQIRGRNIPGSPVQRADGLTPEHETRHPGLTYRQYMGEGMLGKDWWEIPPVNKAANERVDYATQKPEELATRIIQASSAPGMTVADLFSGSGTTAIVAHKQGRRFIASDVGLNAIQATRDRLAAAGASFDILKIQDGIRLFRNPTQTVPKIFSLVDGFKKREELDLGDFWDGGLPGKGGRYTPLKFVGLHERLTPALLDVYLEEIYQLESDDRAEGVRILYAHRDLEADQEYVNKRLHESGKTQLKVELVSLNQLLDKKAASLFTPDSAVVEVKTASAGKWDVTVKQYFSPYLKAKIDEFNAKRGKRNSDALLEANGEDNENGDSEANGENTAKTSAPFQAVKVSESGLELIEAIQFDTTLREDGVWISNPTLEDKAGPKEKVKGRYTLSNDRFRIKFRNIAGDEMTWDHITVPHNTSPETHAKKKYGRKEGTAK